MHHACRFIHKTSHGSMFPADAHGSMSPAGASLEEMVVVHADADLDQEVRYAMAMESDILGELEATIGVATALRGIRD